MTPHHPRHFPSGTKPPGLDPRVKLLSTVLWLLAVTGSTRPNQLLFFALTLLGLLILVRIPPGPLLRTLLMVAPFLAVMGALFLLSYHLASPESTFKGFFLHPYGRLFLVISAKSSLTLMLLRLLMHTTPIPDLLWAMRRFGFPRIVTTLSLLVASYLHLLTEEMDRINRAKKSRSSRRDRHPLRSLAHVAATIFLRSMSRAERLYKAMLARGFTGDYPDIRPTGLSIGDAMAGASAAALILTGVLWIH